MSETKNKPAANFKVGPVRAAVWKNQHQTGDGQDFQSVRVVLERTYKDRSGNYASTTGLGLNDIPKAILALTKAYQYLLEDGGETGDEGASP